MRLNSYTRDALTELERQRDTDYGNTEDCPLCDNGCSDSTVFDVYGRTLCPDCIIEEVRTCLTELLPPEDSGEPSGDILNDIFSDFSDSEILTYIENRFEKL